MTILKVFVVASFDFDSRSSRVVNLDKIMIVRRQRQGFVVKSNLRNPVFMVAHDTKTTPPPTVGAE